MVAIKRESNFRPSWLKAVIPSGRLIFIAALLASVLLAVCLYALYRKPPLERGMDELISAYSEMRSVEPRLSGGFRWARLGSDDMSADSDASKHLRTARDLISEEASKIESVEANHVYARLLIIEGRHDDAASGLRKVLLVQPENVQAINDLGVCLFQLGKLGDALEVFDRALASDPRSHEALFNRALCYQNMGLLFAAGSEYEKLSKIEKDHGWLGEIKNRIGQISSNPSDRKTRDEAVSSFSEAVLSGDGDLSKSLAGKYSDELTGYALLDLSIEYLSNAAAGEREKSEVPLAKIETIGRVFQEVRGDRYIADAAEYLRNLPADEIPVELKLIREYADAVRRTASPDPVKQESGFRELAKLAEIFRERGHIVREERAELRIAKRLYDTNRLEESIDRFERLRPIVMASQWPVEKVDILLGLASAYTRLGQEGLALRFCEQAREALRSLHHPALNAKTSQYESVAYTRLGDLDNALARYSESLRLMLELSQRPEDIAYTHSEISSIHRRRGYNKLALLHAEQALRINESIDSEFRIAQSLSLLATEQAALGMFDEAQSNIDRALSLAHRLEPGRKVYTAPLVHIRAGGVNAEQEDFAKAADHFSEAIELASRAEDNKILLINALTGRSEAFSRLGELNRARADIAVLLDRLESYRSTIEGSQHRSTFLDTSQNAYDQIISLNIGSFNNPEEAFNTSELARARALLDQIQLRGREAAVSGSSPLRLAEVSKALPENLTLIEYAVTESETYIFIASRMGLKVERTIIDAKALDRFVRDFLSQIRSKAPIAEIKKTGNTLYEHLIRPVTRHIKRGESICIVPDKSLHFLPFAALVDGSGEYITRSYRISYAPSASVLVSCLKEAAAKSKQGPERLLAIGNPTFDEVRFSGLPPLPKAEFEVIEAGRNYKHPIIFLGEQAREARVIEAMKRCSVAHLASHCLVEEKSPWLAALLMARGRADQPSSVSGPGNADDGVIYLQELYGMNLPHTKLVVLSACQTGLGQYYRGEGIVSLVRPFIAAGVPTVVASLWAVDNNATTGLMIEFHRARTAGGLGSADSLRAAQIKLSGDQQLEHPFYWAAFVVIGSHF